jgi:hypothetical protein
MRFCWTLTSFIMLFVGAAVWAQTAPTDPRGTYVYTWQLAVPSSPGTPDTAGLIQSLNSPQIDGITLVENWSSVEPERGLFQWDLASSQKWNWSNTAIYVVGDEVTFNSQVYASLVDNNVGQQPDPTCKALTCPWHLTGATTTDLMDQWIRTATAAGKKVILDVRGGVGTPCWLFDASVGQCSGGVSNSAIESAKATRLQFLASAHQGLGQCLGVTIAAPWDPVFEREWDKMLAALAAHLKATLNSDGSSLYDHVTAVRIAGINRTTDELRVPEEILADLTGCPSTPPYPSPNSIVNSIQTWLDAGYTPSRLFEGWNSLTHSYQSHFGDKFLNVPIIPTDLGTQGDIGDQDPFPPIDDNGCVYSTALPPGVVWTTQPCFNDAASVPDQNLPLITLAAQRFPGTLTVEFENIHFDQTTAAPGPPSPALVGYAETLGVIPAFQSNNYLGSPGGGASCWAVTNPARCFPQWYGEMLEAGVSPGTTGSSPDALLRSQYLEVFYLDTNGPDCQPTSPPAGLTGQQLQDAAPGPGCGYPNETLQAHLDLTSLPVVTISFPDATKTHWFTQLPLVGQVGATSAGESITQLSCAGAATGSNPAGFRLHVKEQGNPVTLTCTAQDAAGAKSESIRALWIDTDPPLTTASVNASDSSALVTLTASDAVSGVAETRYRINGGAWTTGTEIALTRHGIYTIEFRSTDVAGNRESTKSITVALTIPPPCRGTKCI